MATQKKQSPSKAREKNAPPAEAQATPPGAALIARLWEEMAKRGHTTHELAEALGITYVYLMKLASGEKPIFQLGRETLLRAAEYLAIPAAQAGLDADPEGNDPVESEEGFVIRARPCNRLFTNNSTRRMNAQGHPTRP